MKKFCWVILLLLIPCVSQAQEFFDESLYFSEEDMVYTASKKEQKIEDAPSPVYIITAEDIKFYGATTVGEALRMVPGIEIIQGGDQNYEVAIRGLSRIAYNTSDKVLWLLNGRSVYNDAFGGFRLQSLNISMNEIERIEVIRGTGSALYGANAYLGIVNIITKSPKELEGFFVEGSYGNLNQTFSSLRYGHQFGDKLWLKMTVGYENIDQKDERLSEYSPSVRDSMMDIGFAIGDKSAYNVKRGNVGLLYDIDPQKSINLYAGYSDNLADHYYIIPGDVTFTDYFVQADYKSAADRFRIFFNVNDGGSYEQSKFLKNIELDDGTRRNVVQDEPEFSNKILDIEYQRSFTFGDNASLIAGASYRHNWVSSTLFSYEGKLAKKEQHLYAFYAQLEYGLLENLHVIAGGRIDEHSLVGTNINPRLATIYKPKENHTFRLGVGTATKNPNFLSSYIDLYMKLSNLKRQLEPYQQQGLTIDPVNNLTFESDYVTYHAMGNEDLEAEKITTYDFGYRYDFNSKFRLTADLFYNEMTNSIRYYTPWIKERVEKIENVHDINPAFAMDLTPLGIESIPNEMTAEALSLKITEIEQLIAQLQGIPEYEETVQHLTQLLEGLYGLMSIFQYDNGDAMPKVVAQNSRNYEEKWKSYGGEIGFNYRFSNNVSLTANYAYLKFFDDYNEVPLEGGGVLDVIKSPEHKFNIGLKFQHKGFYSGVMFNYQSKKKSEADNNGNNVYDVGDLDYPNGGTNEIDPRTNLNVNLGYTWKNFDVYMAGYNLIQDGYKQYEATIADTDPDELNTRFVGGVRIQF